jgi:HSP20 family protein
MGGILMPIAPWRSLWETGFPSFKEEMDKVFEDFFSTAGFPSLKEEGWMPAIDIHETKSDIIVTMDVPAINPKDISIAVIEDKLTVKGERKREKEIKEEDYYRTERVYGSFQRIVSLPTAVVGAKAKATYKDGVLKIAIPRSQKATPKEIKITVK